MSKTSRDNVCPNQARLNHHTARNDQVAATLCEQLWEISLAEGMLSSESLESTSALIYKSWQLH